jgi:hypothetical protein
METISFKKLLAYARPVKTCPRLRKATNHGLYGNEDALEVSGLRIVLPPSLRFHPAMKLSVEGLSSRCRRGPLALRSKIGTALWSRPFHRKLRSALRRAAHRTYDSPTVFKDPIAVAILGSTYAEELRRNPFTVEPALLDRAASVYRRPRPLRRR